MSIRLPLELKQSLENLAHATKRSKSFCTVEAISEYLARESWQIEAIQEGIKDADNGKLVDHKDVKSWVESWDSETEKEKPVCD